MSESLSVEISLCVTGSREILKVFEQYGSMKKTVLLDDLGGKESHKTETSEKVLEVSRIIMFQYYLFS